MRFQISKNRPKFECEHGGFSQRQSQITCYMLQHNMLNLRVSNTQTSDNIMWFGQKLVH